MSRDSDELRAGRLGLDFRQGTTELSLLRGVQTDSGAHPASYLVVLGKMSGA
jgi:hypothetical protein